MNLSSRVRRIFIGLSIVAGVVAGSSIASAQMSNQRSASSPRVAPDIPALGIGGLENAPGLDQHANFGARASVADVAAALTATDTTLTGGADTSMLPGRASLGRGAVLLQNVGVSRRTLYAFPTDRGRVCFALTDVGAGCTDGFSNAVPVNVTVGKPDGKPTGSGEPIVVWGIASNAVKQINVVINGSSHAATLSRNAFFYQLSSNATSAEEVQSLVVTLRGGATRTIDLS
jgi:hypothetical protein